jgi:hypothetical protein
MKKQQCPICRGKGQLEIPKAKQGYLKIELDAKKIAMELRKLEYSLREIAHIMGYNGPQSVKHLIEH